MNGDFEKYLWSLGKDLEEAQRFLQGKGIMRMSPLDHVSDQDYSGYGRISMDELKIKLEKTISIIKEHLR